jgi:hypothetical protein
MERKLNDTPRMNENPRSIAIPFNIDGLNESGMCDLNKVFQVNFTYNIDLLKNLLEGILKFQKTTEEEIESLKEDNKEKNIKLKKIESKLFGAGMISFTNVNKISTTEDKKDGKKYKKENILIGDNISNEQGKIIIHNPKDDNINLEVSESNSDVINKIIVSIFIFINNNIIYNYI